MIITRDTNSHYIFILQQSNIWQDINFIYIWSSCLEMTGVLSYLFAGAGALPFQFSLHFHSKILAKRDLNKSWPDQTK